MGIEIYKHYDLIRSGNFIYTVKYSDEEKTLIYESPGNIPTSSCRFCNSFEIDLYFSQKSDYICINDYIIPGSGIIYQNNIISFERKTPKGFYEIRFGRNKGFILSKDEMFNHFRLHNSNKSINLSEFPIQTSKKSFPEEGFCKTTNKTLIDHICRTREVAKGSSFNLGKHTGIGWNITSCWTVVASSFKTEYKEEELLSLLGITVECPSGQLVEVRPLDLPSGIGMFHYMDIIQESSRYMNTLPGLWYTDFNLEIMNWLRTNYGYGICLSNVKYIGLVGNKHKSVYTDSREVMFKLQGSEYVTNEQVLKFINNNDQVSINQLNNNQDGTSTKTNRVVPRVTTGHRTTGTTVSSRTSKHSITVGHPSNQTIYC